MSAHPTVAMSLEHWESVRNALAASLNGNLLDRTEVARVLTASRRIHQAMTNDTTGNPRQRKEV